MFWPHNINFKKINWTVLKRIFLVHLYTNTGTISGVHVTGTKFFQ